MHKATSLRAGVLLSVHSTKSPRGAPGGLHRRLASRTRPACGRACVPERPVPRRPRAPTSAVGSCPGSGVRRILRITPGSGCGWREHAGRPAARARRVGFPAAAAASRGGFSVSGGRLLGASGGGAWPPGGGGAMWSGRSSFTSLVVGVFVVYVVHTCWVMYGIVYTRPCSGDSNCIQPYLARRPKLQVRVGGPKRAPPGRCYPIPY